MGGQLGGNLNVTPGGQEEQDGGGWTAAGLSAGSQSEVGPRHGSSVSW